MQCEAYRKTGLVRCIRPCLDGSGLCSTHQRYKPRKRAYNSLNAIGVMGYKGFQPVSRLRACPGASTGKE